MNIEQILQQPAGSIGVLNLGNQLDQLPVDKREELLIAGLTKVQPNGKVVIAGIDIILLSKKLQYDNLADMGAYAGIQSFDTVRSLCTKLHNRGFTVLVKLLDQNNCHYQIEAQRNA